MRRGRKADVVDLAALREFAKKREAREDLAVEWIISMRSTLRRVLAGGEVPSLELVRLLKDAAFAIMAAQRYIETALPQRDQDELEFASMLYLLNEGSDDSVLAQLGRQLVEERARKGSRGAQRALQEPRGKR